MCTTGDSLEVRRARRLSELAGAESRVVWRAPATGPCSAGVWAPELHFIRGKWYIYFSADDGSNPSHRIWVLENANQDPLWGEWRIKGQVSDATNRWAIDPTVFEQDSRLFMLWSGWEGAVNVTQHLYIAELSDPWTVKSPRVRISSPEYPWEKVGDSPSLRDPEENPALDPLNPPHVDVNEGPQVLRQGGRIFLVYSAGGCWTDSYCMGMLTAEPDADLLNPASWKKSPAPVFWQSPKANAYGPGHGSFFQSPDGTEHWMVYHANSESNLGGNHLRTPRAQRFTWTETGEPDFGRPVHTGMLLQPPSGEVATVVKELQPQPVYC